MHQGKIVKNKCLTPIFSSKMQKSIYFWTENPNKKPNSNSGDSF